MSFPLSTAMYFEQGFIYYFSNLSVKILLPFANPDTIIMYCSTVLLLAHNAPKVMVISRLSDITIQLFYSVTFNTIMVSVQIHQDSYLNAFNLLSVYFLISMLGHEKSAMTSQYILVTQLSDSLDKLHDSAVSQSIIVIMMIISHSFPYEHACQEISLLLCIEFFFQFVERSVPLDMILPISIIVLYFAYPFFKYYPGLTKIYRYAVFAVGNDTNMKRIPHWISLMAFWGVWIAAIDPISTDLACNLGSQLSVGFLFDLIHVAFMNDPVIVFFSCIISFKILSVIWIKKD